MNRKGFETKNASKPGQMSGERPRVSIALPVYNGEKYVSQAIESALAQTFQDFEIIICDNASTDSTPEICRGYAERDPRVSYHPNEVNRGIHRNFTRGARLSRGEYFMWLSHDDKLAPEFLERCVAALDREPGAVLAYPKAIDIDDQGKYLVYKEQSLNVSSPSAPVRFREMIRMEHNCEASLGLIRGDVLRQTAVLGNYADADRVLLAELALYGHYAKVPEFLFLHREHPLRETNVYPNRFQRTASLNPGNPPKIVFPHFRELMEYFLRIRRAPLSWRDRIRCCWELLRWTKRYCKRLVNDVQVAAYHILRRNKRTPLNRRAPAATSGHGA
jgi:glycosyltransferase involved in cell wall biosynthesis